MDTYYDVEAPDVFRERFGLAFERLTPGLRIAHRPGVTLSQQDNVAESLQTCNGAMLHYDEQYASQTSWQRPLMVSTLTVQRLIGMTWRTFGRRRRIMSMAQIAMTRPVFGGDTLYAETEVLAIRARPGQPLAEVDLRTIGRNQRGETIASIDYTVELWARGQAPGEQPGLAGAYQPRFASHVQREDGAWVEQAGIYFEDLRPGETFIHAPRRSIHAHDGIINALLAQEWSGAHHDLMYAAELGLEAPVVPQTWVLGCAVALSTRTFGRVCANLGWTQVEFGEAAAVGDTLQARSVILNVRGSASRPAEGIVTTRTMAHNQRGALVVAFVRTLLVYRRGEQAPYAAAGY